VIVYKKRPAGGQATLRGAGVKFVHNYNANQDLGNLGIEEMCASLGGEHCAVEQELVTRVTGFDPGEAEIRPIIAATLRSIEQGRPDRAAAFAKWAASEKQRAIAATTA
jgi:hypothetical protein